MRHTKLIGDEKSFLMKVAFFLVLLLFIGFMYLESNMIVDAVYFGIVFTLFVKFLLVKLYR